MSNQEFTWDFDPDVYANLDEADKEVKRVQSLVAAMLDRSRVAEIDAEFDPEELKSFAELERRRWRVHKLERGQQLFEQLQEKLYTDADLDKRREANHEARRAAILQARTSHGKKVLPAKKQDRDK